jgi:hypothetical protein
MSWTIRETIFLMASAGSISFTWRWIILRENVLARVVLGVAEPTYYLVGFSLPLGPQPLIEREVRRFRVPRCLSRGG